MTIPNHDAFPLDSIPPLYTPSTHTLVPTYTTYPPTQGTTVYLPPEYERFGIVSTSMDIFSFGVVLLELMTALPPYDATREDYAGLVSARTVHFLGNSLLVTPSFRSFIPTLKLFTPTF